MRKQIEYGTLKFTDWSKMQYLTPDQVRKLILEKAERAKLLSEAMSRQPKKHAE